MQAVPSDGIFVVDDIIDSDKRDFLIDYFERSHRSGTSYSRKPNFNKYEINDDALFLYNQEHLVSLEQTGIIKDLKDLLIDKLYVPYAEHFDILSRHGQHLITGIKLQRTDVGQGYHVWHSEAMTRDSSARLLTFIVYLNTIDEGGETEFLYFPKRIKPKAGRGILFPCQFQHTHRGNQPLTGAKYVVTGWIDYV